MVEKGYLAGEQSSRNWGWCRQQNRDLRELPLAQRALEIWGGLNQELGAETGFRGTGLVYVTKNQSDLDAWSSWIDRARELQMHSHMLSAAEAKAMTPGSTGDWIGGLRSPTDGKAEPALAVPAIAEGARRQGATIPQDCAARGSRPRPDASARSSPRKARSAPARCSSPAAWTSMFCRHHGIAMPLAGVRSTSSSPRRRRRSPKAASRLRTSRSGAGSTAAFIGIPSRGLLELSPQGLMYAKAFWRTFKKRYRLLTIRAGRSFFDGPEALLRWSNDTISPFERMRTYDPPAQESW